MTYLDISIIPDGGVFFSVCFFLNLRKFSAIEWVITVCDHLIRDCIIKVAQENVMLEFPNFYVLDFATLMFS